MDPAAESTWCGRDCARVLLGNALLRWHRWIRRRALDPTTFRRRACDENPPSNPHRHLPKGDVTAGRRRARGTRRKDVGAAARNVGQPRNSTLETGARRDARSNAPNGAAPRTRSSCLIATFPSTALRRPHTLNWLNWGCSGGGKAGRRGEKAEDGGGKRWRAFVCGKTTRIGA